LQNSANKGIKQSDGQSQQKGARMPFEILQETKLIVSQDDIVDLLVRKRIFFGDWGVKGTSQPLSELIRSVNEDQVTLEDPGLDKPPLLRVQNAAVYVIYFDIDGTYLELHETKQVFKNDSTQFRGFRGISRTLKILRTQDDIDEFERPIHGAYRALGEELGQTEPRFNNPDNLVCLKQLVPEETTAKSVKWPGLNAIHTRHLFKHEIKDPSFFHREGYREERAGVTTFFEWTKT
jgi:hypothetical protein